MAAATLERFGAPNFLFNNAGVGAGGLTWEHSLKDWEWVVGVNLMGVAHGIRVFTPAMLAAAKADARWHGHIVNTASMAGLLNAPNMGVYNATKAAVVSISETLKHDHVVRLYKPVPAWTAGQGQRFTLQVSRGVAEFPRRVAFVVTDGSGAQPLQAVTLGC